MSASNVHNAIVGLVSVYGEVVEQISRENAQLRAQNESLQKQLATFTKAITERDEKIVRLSRLVGDMTEPAEPAKQPG